MYRRELLRSSAFAGAGLVLSGTTAAAVANAGGSQQAAGNGPTLLSRERTLGRGTAALTVSAVSLGCMGMHGGRGRTPPETMMEKLIRQAYDRGCTLFDTAEGYSNGRNEELLGRAIAPFRDKVVVGTKFTVDLTKTPPQNDNRPERIKAACEGSLRRLKTDVIDLYHQHRVDRSVPIEDVAGAVAELIKEGKVRRFALSARGT